MVQQRFEVVVKQSMSEAVVDHWVLVDHQMSEALEVHQVLVDHQMSEALEVHRVLVGQIFEALEDRLVWVDQEVLQEQPV